MVVSNFIYIDRFYVIKSKSQKLTDFSSNHFQLIFIKPIKRQLIFELQKNQNFISEFFDLLKEFHCYSVIDDLSLSLLVQMITIEKNLPFEPIIEYLIEIE